MKSNLPDLNQDRLNIIFDHVYDIVSVNKGNQMFYEEKLSHLLDTLKLNQCRPYPVFKIFLSFFNPA